MIFKGIHFRKARRIVSLPVINPETKERMPYVKAGNENYTYFGRVLPDQSKADPCKHVLTSWFLDSNPDVKLWAEVIPDNGHSLTNMMYGQDGRVYLYYKGIIYTAGPRKPSVVGS